MLIYPIRRRHFCKRCCTSFRVSPKRKQYCSEKCRVPDLVDRFFENVNGRNKNGCIIWLGAPSSKGYGQIASKGKKYLAHRVSYELFVGPIPEGKQVLHTCDVRRCVEPNHLFPGTNLDNVKDMMAKNRQRKGERHGQAKLKEKEVVEMRKKYATGEYSYGQLSIEYCVSPAHVRDIVHRVWWKHI